MPRATFATRRPRPVHAVLLALGCTAIAVPLITNNGAPERTVEVQRGYVSAERPVHRFLRGSALGSRKLTTATASASEQQQLTISPRYALPTRLRAPTADTAPDLRTASLTVEATVPPTQPADVTATAQPPKQRFTEPRRKPPIPVRIAELSTLEPLLMRPTVDSIATALPEIIGPPVPIAPATPSSGPRIALVVTAAGIHEGTTRKAIDALPDTITLAFAPIGKKTGDLARAAIADGHTILAEVPMEPMNPVRDPGEPLTLRVGNTGPDNIARLDKTLARVPGAAGISSYLGAKFTRSEDAATPVIDEIAARGLFLFENQPNGQSRLGALARTGNVAYAASALSIDTDRDTTLMLKRLSDLEAQARREGVAIGVATAYRETILTLDEWIAGAKERGVVFVPITRINEAG